MTFLFELANKPGAFFVETETIRLDEVTRMCYAGREVKGSQELLAELVSLGFTGFVYDDECYLDYLAVNPPPLIEVAAATL